MWSRWWCVAQRVAGAAAVARRAAGGTVTVSQADVGAARAAAACEGMWAVPVACNRPRRVTRHVQTASTTHNQDDTKPTGAASQDEQTQSSQEQPQEQPQEQQPPQSHASTFVVPDDVPPVRFVQRYSIEPIHHMLAMRTAKAYAIADETLRTSLNVSMHDKTKKKGRPRDPIRGMVILPHLFKPAQRVIVFARGKDIDDALDAGATAAGLSELLEQVVDGEIDFDVALATPDVLRDIRSAGRTLRQRMPSVKNGTIVEDVKEGVLRFSRGMLYRTDAHGNLNIPFGKSSQPLEVLEENLLALVDNILQHNLGARDKFIEKLFISSDQGRAGSLEVDRSRLLAALNASQQRAREATA